VICGKGGYAALFVCFGPEVSSGSEPLMSDAVLKNIPGMKQAEPVAVLRAEDLPEGVFFRDHVSNSQPCVIKARSAIGPPAAIGARRTI
jgi:hypothetical protein